MVYPLRETNFFFLNNVEVSISSLANALNVNRRTLYETIKFINKMMWLEP